MRAQSGCRDCPTAASLLGEANLPIGLDAPRKSAVVPDVDLEWFGRNLSFAPFHLLAFHPPAARPLPLGELLEIKPVEYRVVDALIERRMGDFEGASFGEGFEAIKVVLVLDLVPRLEPPVARVYLCLA
jgi:hypothetical protein